MIDVTPDILKRCRTGDASAFAHVVETYERPLFAFVYRFTAGEKQVPEPEDIVQEIFLKVWKSFSQWDPDRSASFQSWLFSIARNYMVSLLRKYRPEMVRDNDEGDGLFARMPDELAPSPRQNAENNQLSNRVAEAISILPEKLRTAFVLRYYEDLPYDEIAEILQCQVGTVKSRISRAREVLSVQLKDHFDQECRRSK